MHLLPRLIIAALLVAAAATTATAQNQRRTHAPQRVQPVQSTPNLATDPYGERPTSPGAVPCSERPFAQGCDKRGFW
jgi:hypothetical protein